MRQGYRGKKNVDEKQFYICSNNKMIVKNRRCFLGELTKIFSAFLQFYLFATLSCTSVFAAQPFTFDPFTLKIYNLPDSRNVNPSIPYAVACPFRSVPVNLHIKQKESLALDGLFVEYYNVGQQPSTHITCGYTFKMAAVHRRDDDSIEFGYKIFYMKKKAPKNIYKSHFTHYGMISEARFFWSRIPNNWILREMWPSPKSHREGFTWIPRIKLRYNTDKWSFISTKYSIHRNVAKELTVKCDNHDLGKRFYDEEHDCINCFYTRDNQEKIFSLVDLSKLPETSVCKKTSICVRKYNILKPYHFRSSYGSLVYCSYLTTIPIWYEVSEKLLNNLEIFLFALGQVTENSLTILPGVYDTLSLMTKNTRKPRPMPIYLYTERERIPVPKILYKIVRYKTYDCKEKVELCWFDIVIVIHNHPGSAKKHMICPEDKCREYGWEIIKFVYLSKEGEASEYIYCCQLDKSMQEKLGYKIGKELRGDFNLKNFPVYDKKREENRYEDRQNQIEKQTKQLQIDISMVPTQDNEN